MMKVTNNQGRSFNVRIVLQGHSYGLNDCLTHNKADPLVEFYDADAKPAFGPRGQFVSRYYLSTLKEHSPYHGLCLDCAHADLWYVTVGNVKSAIRYAMMAANA